MFTKLFINAFICLFNRNREGPIVRGGLTPSFLLYHLTTLHIFKLFYYILPFILLLSTNALLYKFYIALPKLQVSAEPSQPNCVF